MVGGRFVVSNNVVLVDSRRRVPARTLCDSTCHCGGPSTRTGTSCAGSKQFDSHLASVARDWRRRRLLEPTVRDAHHLNDARQALDSCRRRHHSRQLCMAEITRITITAVVCCLLDTQRFAVGRGRDMLSCLAQLVFGDERLVLSAWASLATAQAGTGKLIRLCTIRHCPAARRGTVPVSGSASLPSALSSALCCFFFFFPAPRKKHAGLRPRRRQYS